MKGTRQLEGLLGELDKANPVWETVAREVAETHEHELQMGHRSAPRRKKPLGCGAVETACGQCPCRFMRTGPFWSPAGGEALLPGLDTFWRNRRWHVLFPHSRPTNLSKRRQCAEALCPRNFFIAPPRGLVSNWRDTGKVS